MIRNFQSGVLYLWAGIVYRSFIGIYKYIISYRSGPLQEYYSATYVPTQRSSRLSPTFWSVVFLRWKLRTPTYTTIGPLLGIDWKHTILFWKEYTKYTLNIVQCQRRSICIHCAGGVMSNLCFPVWRETIESYQNTCYVDETEEAYSGLDTSVGGYCISYCNVCMFLPHCTHRSAAIRNDFACD